MIRSDVKKLTACREVAGFYKPLGAKSRLNTMPKAPGLQPLLALVVLHDPRVRELRENR